MNKARPVFNSLHSFDALMEAGVSEKKARACITVLGDTLQSSIKQIATQTQLRETRQELQTQFLQLDRKIDVFNSEIKGEIKTLQTNFDFLKRLFFGGIVLILLSNITLFLHH